MEREKKYKITYKTYFNDRLNKVVLGQTETYPLYLQATYRRKSIFFRSDLFANLLKRKTNTNAARKRAITINDIIKKEGDLLKWAADTLTGDFTLEAFKQAYEFYATDLCLLAEEDFRLCLFLFFNEMGMNILSMVLANNSRDYDLYDLFKEMEVTFDQTLYGKLIEKVFSYGHMAPAFLLLNAFLIRKGSQHKFLTIMDWKAGNTRSEFEKFLKDSYPDKDATKLLSIIDTRITKLNNGLY